jgi:hypothetical protein
LPLFFLISHFSVFFFIQSYSWYVKTDFFHSSKKKLFFINPSYTQARCLGFNSQLRFASVCLSLCFSVSLFLCLSASLSFSPFLDVGLCFLLFYFVSLFLFVFFFSPYHLLFSTSFFICFLCRYSPYQSSLTWKGIALCAWSK